MSIELQKNYSDENKIGNIKIISEDILKNLEDTYWEDKVLYQKSEGFWILHVEIDWELQSNIFYNQKQIKWFLPWMILDEPAISKKWISISGRETRYIINWDEAELHYNEDWIYVCSQGFCRSWKNWKWELEKNFVHNRKTDTPNKITLEKWMNIEGLKMDGSMCINWKWMWPEEKEDINWVRSNNKWIYVGMDTLCYSWKNSQWIFEGKYIFNKDRYKIYQFNLEKWMKVHSIDTDNHTVSISWVDIEYTVTDYPPYVSITKSDNQIYTNWPLCYKWNKTGLEAKNNIFYDKNSETFEEIKLKEWMRIEWVDSSKKNILINWEWIFYELGSDTLVLISNDAWYYIGKNDRCLTFNNWVWDKENIFACTYNSTGFRTITSPQWMEIQGINWFDSTVLIQNKWIKYKENEDNSFSLIRNNDWVYVMQEENLYSTPKDTTPHKEWAYPRTDMICCELVNWVWEINNNFLYNKVSKTIDKVTSEEWMNFTWKVHFQYKVINISDKWITYSQNEKWTQLFSAKLGEKKYYTDYNDKKTYVFMWGRFIEITDTDTLIQIKLAETKKETGEVMNY